MTVFGEPAGRDPNSEQIRRIPNRGAGRGGPSENIRRTVCESRRAIDTKV